MDPPDEVLEPESPFVAPPPIGPDEITPEEEPAPPPEPETGQEPEPASHRPTPEYIEAELTKIAKRADTYSKFVAERLTDADQEVLRCPLCITGPPGFLDRGMIGQYPREAVAQVTEIMTGFKQEQYQQLPGFETCSTCNGLGEGLTGSKVPQRDKAVCPACRGAGYTAPPGAAANGHAPEAAEALGATEAPFAADDDFFDEWDEPKILPDGRMNPNHGKMPHRKVIDPKFGITAGLGKEASV